MMKAYVTKSSMPCCDVDFVLIRSARNIRKNLTYIKTRDANPRLKTITKMAIIQRDIKTIFDKRHTKTKFHKSSIVLEIKFLHIPRAQRMSSRSSGLLLLWISLYIQIPKTSSLELFLMYIHLVLIETYQNFIKDSLSLDTWAVALK